MTPFLRKALQKDRLAWLIAVSNIIVSIVVIMIIIINIIIIIIIDLFSIIFVVWP